jgi:hypothetical protein
LIELGFYLGQNQLMRHLSSNLFFGLVLALASITPVSCGKKTEVEPKLANPGDLPPMKEKAPPSIRGSSGVIEKKDQ